MAQIKKKMIVHRHRNIGTILSDLLTVDAISLLTISKILDEIFTSVSLCEDETEDENWHLKNA